MDESTRSVSRSSSRARGGQLTVGRPQALNDLSVRQRPLGKFAAGSGGLFAGSDHMAFLDGLFDHRFKIGASSSANSQPIEVLGLRCGENLILDFLRPGIALLEAE